MVARSRSPLFNSPIFCDVRQTACVRSPRARPELRVPVGESLEKQSVGSRHKVPNTDLARQPRSVGRGHPRMGGPAETAERCPAEPLVWRWTRSLCPPCSLEEIFALSSVRPAAGLAEARRHPKARCRSLEVGIDSLLRPLTSPSDPGALASEIAVALGEEPKDLAVGSDWRVRRAQGLLPQQEFRENFRLSRPGPRRS
jgi:hypothetical protein